MGTISADRKVKAGCNGVMRGDILPQNPGLQHAAGLLIS
jgi:hypothetical protein